jgi:hypothetical protein
MQREQARPASSGGATLELGSQLTTQLFEIQARNHIKVMKKS